MLVLSFTCLVFFSILCKTGTLDPTKVKGKILACLRGENARVEKGLNAARAGAVGMILCNDDLSGNGVLADPHFLPASHLTYEDGQSLLQYINTTKYVPIPMYIFSFLKRAHSLDITHFV